MADVKPIGILSAYEPSLRDRIAFGIGGLLGGDNYRQGNTARKIGGLLDFIPGIGEAIGLDEAKQDFNAGNYGMAAAGLGLTAAGALPIVGDMAAKAGKRGIKAFHSTFEPFDEFDFSRLGQTTAPNVEGTGVEDWAMNLARLGAWASDKPIGKQMGASVDLGVEISGRGKAYKSLDALESATRKAGGSEKLRQKLLAEGYGHVRVRDEEFGANSFVGLAPSFFKITKD